MPPRRDQDDGKKLTGAECDAYTLCYLLGRWDHPDEMMEALTAEQYLGWEAWLRKYHPAPNRDDVHWGLLLSMIHNQWADPADRVSPEDMMPYRDRFEADVTADELVGCCSF